jgi:hypothetical protein
MTVNDDLMAWFHCGRCGTLFKSLAGGGDRRCTSCGEDPSLGLEADQAPALVKTGRDPMLRVKVAEIQKPSGRQQIREERPEKANYFVLKLVIGWVCVMGLLALAAQLFWKEDNRVNGPNYAESVTKDSSADEDMALLSRGYRECSATMAGFISATSQEEKNQFVKDSARTASMMARFYQLNPLSNIDPQTMRNADSGVIHIAEGVSAIETRWKTTDGMEVDAVFFEEGGEWRLDWPEYVRYSEEPLSFFLGGTGEAEGEFRVFARERFAEQRRGTGSLRLVFHAPVFGHPGEADDGSPEFIIDQDSEDGRLIKAALLERKAGRRILGSRLPSHDPDGMVRLRVKLRRLEGNTGKEFKLDKVIAAHWLSVDQTGVKK